MQEINLYIVTEQKGNAPEDGRVAYRLEVVLKTGAKRKQDIRQRLQDKNKNGAMLEALCDALKNHIKSGMDIRLNVFSTAQMMNTQISNGNIYTWEGNGFRKADGSPIAYADLWEIITKNIREKLHCRISTYSRIPEDIKEELERMINT